MEVGARRRWQAREAGRGRRKLGIAGRASYSRGGSDSGPVPQKIRKMTLLLTHGAGSNRNAPLLVAVDEALTAIGVAVIRYDLPFRQQRPHGPPLPAHAAADREGLRQTLSALSRPV